MKAYVHSICFRSDGSKYGFMTKGVPYRECVPFRNGNTQVLWGSRWRRVHLKGNPDGSNQPFLRLREPGVRANVLFTED